MLYKYQSTTQAGQKQNGNIDAPSVDIAISSLQRRGLIVSSIEPVEQKGGFFGSSLFQTIKNKDVVILSRQLATLFEAKVPVVESFKLLAAESPNPAMRQKLAEVVGDIQGGISMSQAMARHPEVFSKFYVNIIRIGEESGKLDEMFNHMADYMERNYELTSRAKNALLYPAFVISTFIVIMILMLAIVIPRLAVVLKDLGGQLPIYTRILLGFSDFIRNTWFFILAVLAIGTVFIWRYFQTTAGKMVSSRLLISVPYVGDIYRKIYLARLSDNLSTLLGSGIPVLTALEITSDVVGNEVYRAILLESAQAVKSGSSLSSAFSQYDDIPGLVSQMAKIGEEGGKLTFVLTTMARFYKREVDNLVENLVGLIEPVMIVILGLAVGFLVMAVLGPIYSITSTI